jgi:hypothetical protein
VLQWNRELFEGIYRPCEQAIKDGLPLEEAKALVLKDPRVASRARDTKGFEAPTSASTSASPTWKPKLPGSDKLLVRQINQDSDQALVDFRGETTTHARFATGEKIKLVPVVAFYGPNGRRLADSIVGARLPDFYPSYLETAIEQSTAALKAKPPAH